MQPSFRSVRQFSTNIRPFNNAFTQILKAHLSFEECERIYESSKTRSMSLTTLMITLCSKHKRSGEDRRKYIDELKKSIYNHDDEITQSSRAIDFALSTLMQEESFSDVIHLGKKLGDSTLASLNSFRLDQILKTLSNHSGSNQDDFELARRIFNILLERREVSMYARNYHALCVLRNSFEEGLKILEGMNAQRIKILDNVFLFSLTDSVKKNKQEESRRICTMIEHSDTSNKVLLTIMVNFYNKCGLYDKAIKITRSLSKDRLDTTSYNCLIQSFIGKGDMKQAINVLDEMQHNNISPDSASFTILLTACAESKDLEQGLHVLSQQNKITKKNIRMLNAIINFYNRCEQYDFAIEYLKKIPKDRLDTTSYICLIQSFIGKGDLNQAINVLEMQHKNSSPDWDSIMVILITACAKNKDIEQGLRIIDIIGEDKFSNNHLTTSILNFYNKCEQYSKAIEHLKKIPKDRLDITSYNCLIQSFIGKGDMKQAINVLDEMQHNNISPNSTTYTIILTACADNKDIEKGLIIIDLIGEDKLTSHLTTSILNFYNKCEQYDMAIEYLKNIPKDRLDSTSYNCLIQSFIGKGNLKQAINVLDEMQHYGIPPNTTTFTIVLTGCAENKDLDQGLRIMDILGEDTFSNNHLTTSILNFYNKCEQYDMAIEYHDRIPKDRLDTIQYNCLIQSFIGKCDLGRAFDIFNLMTKEGKSILPDKTTFLILLVGCAELVSPVKGQRLIKEIQGKNLDSCEMIKSAMLIFYSKICNQKKTTELMNIIVNSNPSIISYNCILASYAHHGEGRKALKLFNNLVKQGVRVNGETITIILNALSYWNGRRSFTHLQFN